MNNDSRLEDLLEELEDARDSGAPLQPEDVCADSPELLLALREKWRLLLSFDENFGQEDSSGPQTELDAPKAEQDLVAKLLAFQGELRLTEFHDQGGLADVFRGEDRNLKRAVAVKVLRSDRELPSNASDFRRESQIIGRMNHPGIVSIYTSGETGEGRPFYSMPFLEGGNLRSRIRSFHENYPKRLQDAETDFRDLIYRLISACKTIAYAHSRGIIHRDLKAENILLGRYGETLIIDWGCAEQVDREERFKVYGEGTLRLDDAKLQARTKSLTLRYASPEQLHGNRPVGPESDIYSLGAVLYVTLTGSSPLDRVASEKIRSTVLSGQIPAPDSLKPGIPRALSAICQKAMSLSPADRYPNALSMADDLERYLADEEVSACKSTVGMRMSRIVRRNRSASVILLSTLLVSSLLLTIAFAGQSLFANLAAASARARLQMAASLAASVGGFEIDRRITLLENEAKRAQFVQAMLDIHSHPGEPELWLPAQNMLYAFRDSLTDRGFQLESLFLTDAAGTQVARSPKTNSVGENFAFRHYFHGLDEDLDTREPGYSAPPPSRRPIVSNAYVSTNRNEAGEYPIKTSFSVPIFGDQQDGEPQVIGRLGMSVRINQLSIFERLESLALDGVLIETKDYTWGTSSAKGIVLDRIHSQTPGTTVPVNSVLEEDADSEKEIQDAMQRLTSGSLDMLDRQLDSSQNAQLLTAFYDPAVAPEQQDAAVANLFIPHRGELDTGWTVLFIDRPTVDR